MKRLFLIILLLGMAFDATGIQAQEDNDLKKSCDIVSKFDAVLKSNQKDMNGVVYYRFGWNKKAPSKIFVQFVNFGYADHKLKFAVKDVTSKKMVVLDAVHHSRFGIELLKESSKGGIWSGPVDNINDSFSLHVWADDGEEADKDPMSAKDQK